MAIPSSGQVGLGTIRTELQNTGTSNFALSKAGSQNNIVRNQGYTPLNRSSTALPGATAPYAVSEWRNYDHSATKLCGSVVGGPVIQDVAPGAAYTYYAVTVTGAAGWDAQHGVEGLLIGSTQQIKVNIYQSYPFSNIGTLTGTPAASVTFNGSAGASQSQAVTIPMLSSSEVHHIVIWDDSIL